MRHTTIPEFFSHLPDYFNPDAAAGLSAVYQFDLSEPQGGQYHLVIDAGACAIQSGIHPEPHVTLSMTGEDCLGILTGRLEGHTVLMSGRIRVSGDLTLAVMLKTLFPTLRDGRSRTKADPILD